MTSQKQGSPVLALSLSRNIEREGPSRRKEKKIDACKNITNVAHMQFT